jgi:predicted enzyme related to lactoylglutathione lyase
MIHFGFTKIVVSDLERCAAFYSEVFGLTEQYRVRSDVAGHPMEEIMYGPTAPEGGSFVLLRFSDGAGQSDAAASGVIPGFVTDEIDALFTRVAAAGGTVAQAVYDAPEHGVRVGILADPEGRYIEVVQRLPNV